MIITISGQAGSGKSTVARLLSEKLHLKHYSMGDMRRKMADERGMTLAALNALGETQDFTDREVDEFQKGLGEREDGLVIDGRTSWYFIPHSLKVYLDAEPGDRARRVFQDERSVEKFASIEETEKALETRERSDRSRYWRYYGIDVHDRKHYDVVLDTTQMQPQRIAESIVGYIKDRGILQGPEQIPSDSLPFLKRAEPLVKGYAIEAPSLPPHDGSGGVGYCLGV